MPLIFQFDPKTGSIERVSSNVARVRRVFADPDYRDLAVEDVRDTDAVRAWRAPEYPKERK